MHFSTIVSAVTSALLLASPVTALPQPVGDIEARTNTGCVTRREASNLVKKFQTIYTKAAGYRGYADGLIDNDYSERCDAFAFAQHQPAGSITCSGKSAFKRRLEQTPAVRSIVTVNVQITTCNSFIWTYKYTVRNKVTGKLTTLLGKTTFVLKAVTSGANNVVTGCQRPLLAVDLDIDLGDILPWAKSTGCGRRYEGQLVSLVAADVDVNLGGTYRKNLLSLSAALDLLGIDVNVDADIGGVVGGLLGGLLGGKE